VLVSTLLKGPVVEGKVKAQLLRGLRFGETLLFHKLPKRRDPEDVVLLFERLAFVQRERIPPLLVLSSDKRPVVRVNGARWSGLL